MTEFKTLVLDLDGTLTNSKKELTPITRDAIIRAQERGIRVVLASGRPTFGVVPLAKELKLEQFGGYILSFNGGTIIDCEQKKVIFETLLPQDLIAPIYKATKQADCTLLTYCGEKIMTENPKDKYAQYESFLNKMEVAKTSDFLSLPLDELSKCLAVGDEDKVVKLESMLLPLFGDSMSIYRSEPFFLELVPLGIDKAQSLERLMRHLGLSREQMLAFGDGYNDISMLEYAGCGVAMANAQQSVKDAANYITDHSNDDDGVARWLEKMV